MTDDKVDYMLVIQKIIFFNNKNDDNPFEPVLNTLERLQWI